MAVLQDGDDGSFVPLPHTSNAAYNSHMGPADLLERERSVNAQDAARIPHLKHTLSHRGPVPTTYSIPPPNHSDNYYYQSPIVQPHPHHPQSPRLHTPRTATDPHNQTSPTHQLPSPPLSPRWDSLRGVHPQATHRSPISNPTSPVASTFRDSSASGDSQRTAASSHLETREEFPSLPENSVPPVTVSNFSRPRLPSIKQPVIHDSPRLPQLDLSAAPSTNWSRSRGPSISSNQSSSTYASLPVRPPHEPHSRDSPRGRTRHPHPPPTSRPALLYERAESTGPALRRDPIHRMASLPNDELRASYRSQLSASTAQGTLATERSSVLTKDSSVNSMYGPVDDNLSVDDVLGFYDKGFDDDSEVEEDDLHDESRPPTAASVISKGFSTVLEAEAEPDELDLPQPPFRPPIPGTIVRDSADIFVMSKHRPTPSEGPGINDVPQSNVEATPVERVNSFRPGAPTRHETFQTLTNDDERDRYGFKKSNQYITRGEYDQWDQGYSEYLARRRKKWAAHLKDNGLMTDAPNRFPARSPKTRRFVRKGIPPDWRGSAWFYYAGGPAIVAKNAGLYESLLQETVKDVDAEAIERDLHRTFPDNIRFRSSAGPNVPPQEGAAKRNSQQTVTGSASLDARSDETPMISALRRVLSAFSIYNPRIGYCQSLNFLAGLLLLFVESEEHAFWLLNIITRVYLPGTHEMSLEGANVDLGVLMTTIQETMPNVWVKIGGELDGTEAVRPKSRRRKQRVELTTRLPPITLCMTAWFMSCFIGTLPIESTLRVWDIFFYEGSKTLFQIALTIFRIGEPEIKKVGDPMEIFQVVQTMPRKMIDANGLMAACYKRRNGFGALGQETIDLRRKERRNHVKAEKEKLAVGEPIVSTDPDVNRKGPLFKRKPKDPPRQLDLDA